MLDDTTWAILRGFAHRLVGPGRRTRMIVLQDAVPELGLAPGDGVVYTAGNAAAGGRWLVLKTLDAAGKPRFAVDRAPACPPACACLCVYARRQAGRRVHAGGPARAYTQAGLPARTRRRACPRVHAGGLAHRICGRVLFTIHETGDAYD